MQNDHYKRNLSNNDFVYNFALEKILTENINGLEQFHHGIVHFLQFPSI